MELNQRWQPKPTAEAKHRIHTNVGKSTTKARPKQHESTTNNGTSKQH